MVNSNGSFEIVRTLGVGGMATVYLARHHEGGQSRTVALKKPHAFLADDPSTFAILEDEAQLGKCIRHPNVVDVIGLVPGASEKEAPSLVMEWIDGVDLGKLVRAAAAAGRRLPVDVVAAIARDMLAGLHAAHEGRREDGLALDIVHRDVSPQNVLVGFDGVVRVTDFGVARATWRQQQTEDGSIKGKLRYLAPEQLSGRCDRRADVFGVGAVVWELLTGERMRAGDGVEMLVEIMCAHVQAPSAFAPEAALLDAVVMRALERCPEERFATAEEMLQAIERAVTVASPERVAEIVRAIIDRAEAPKVEQSEQPLVAAASAMNVLTALTEAPVPATRAPRAASWVRRGRTRAVATVATTLLPCRGSSPPPCNDARDELLAAVVVDHIARSPASPPAAVVGRRVSAHFAFGCDF